MDNFTYVRATSVTNALQAIGDGSGHGNGNGHHGRFLAGGTTLVDLMRLDVLHANRLVDITSIRELQTVSTTGTTELLISAQGTKAVVDWQHGSTTEGRLARGAA